MAEECWSQALFVSLAMVVPARTSALSTSIDSALNSGAPLALAPALPIKGVQHRCTAALADVLELIRVAVLVSNNGGARGTRT